MPSHCVIFSDYSSPASKSIELGRHNVLLISQTRRFLLSVLYFIAKIEEFLRLTGLQIFNMNKLREVVRRKIAVNRHTDSMPKCIFIEDVESLLRKCSFVC